MTEEKVRHLTPVGRLIHESLFEKDQYTTDKGKDGDPAYKIEVAFDRDDVEGEGTLEDALIDAVVAEWGEAAEQQFLDGKIRSCLIDGDELKARREEKGIDQVQQARYGRTRWRSGLRRRRAGDWPRYSGPDISGVPCAARCSVLLLRRTG